MNHTTKSGQKIKIAEMSDSHLSATIALLRRRCAAGITVFAGGGTCAEDMWCDCELLTGKHAEEYVNLEAYITEANRRNL